MKLTKVQRTVLERMKYGTIFWWGAVPFLVWWDKDFKRQFMWITRQTVEALKRRGLLMPQGGHIALVLSDAGCQALKGGRP